MPDGAPDAPDLGIPGVVNPVIVGRGGFSTVYQCEQPAYRRLVAVKVLDVDVADPRSRRAFDRECQTLGSLSTHPNIVTLYDSGVSSRGRPYLVMEYIGGGSLTDLLEGGGRFSVPDGTAIGVKLSGAVATAHAAGILHGDIKPENVLMTFYGEPKLVDFGVARLLETTRTMTARIRVSLVHAAPEVLSGAVPTERSDVWSLASTAATVLAGTPPFLGENDAHPQAVVARILTVPPPDLRSLGVPSVVCEVLEAALDKDPAQRTPTAEAFGEGLREARRALGLPPTTMAVLSPAGASEPFRSNVSHTAPRPALASTGRRAPSRLRGRIWAVVGAVVVALAASLALLLGGERGPAGWRGDRFAGTSIDPSRWQVTRAPGSDVTEHGHLEVTLSAAAAPRTEAAVLTTTCGTGGDFDIEVSYVLTRWPRSSRGRVALIAGPVRGSLVAGGDSGLVAPQRFSEGSGEFYAINVNESVYPAVALSPSGSLVGQASTGDPAGQIRLVRQYETYTAFTRRGRANAWNLLGQTTKPVGGPTAFSLQVWVDQPAPLAVALSDFRLTSGSCS